MASKSSSEPFGGSNEGEPLVKKAKEPLKLRTAMTIFIACLAGMQSHHCIGSSNGIMAPVAEDFAFEEIQTQVFMAGVILGCVPGALITGWIADQIGRLKTLSISMLCSFIGVALMAFSGHWITLMLGRIFSGFALGMAVVVVPLYIGEVSPARIRGMICTVGTELSFNAGQFISVVWCAIFAYIRPQKNYGMGRGWRWICGVGLVMPIIIVAMQFFGIESPRWLAMKRRFSEARQNFNLLFGPVEARETFEKAVAMDQEDAGDREKGKETSMLEMITSERTRGAVLVGVGSSFFSQVSGIGVFVFYACHILQFSGWTYLSALRIVSVIFALNLLSIMVCGQIVDSWGRRPLLLLSAVGVTLSNTIVCFSTYAAGAWWSSWLTVFGIGMFDLFFYGGWGPIPYTLNAEIYPADCRSQGLVLATIISRSSGALSVGTFLTMVDFLGMAGTFAFYGLVNLLAFFFVLACVPETKGMALEDAGKLVQCGGPGGREASA